MFAVRFSSRRGLLLTIVCALSAFSHASVNAQTATPAAQARALFKEYWEYQLREDPILATSVGDHRYDDKLPSMTLQDIARRTTAKRTFLTRLQRIRPATLNAEDRISYEMMERELKLGIEAFEVKRHLIPLTVDDGFHIQFAFVPSWMPFRTTRDYEKYIARLRAFPRYTE